METNKKCAVCGSADMETVIGDEIYRYKGQTIAIPDFKKFVCNNCGEDFGDPQSVKASVPLLRDFQRTIDGFLTSKEIRAIRKSCCCTQDEFSDLLGGGAKAFARYENGAVLQGKPMDTLLRVLRAHPELIHEIKKDGSAPLCYKCNEISKEDTVKLKELTEILNKEEAKARMPNKGGEQYECEKRRTFIKKLPETIKP